ncbi:MAG: hypothetical protein FWG68_10135 [Defluviitaleaceae bacterium]|nr:hypothetical protein [Defluviitaleaceae bacterium]
MQTKNEVYLLDAYPIIEECETIADCFAQMGATFSEEEQTPTTKGKTYHLTAYPPFEEGDLLTEWFAKIGIIFEEDKEEEE